MNKIPKCIFVPYALLSLMLIPCAIAYTERAYKEQQVHVTDVIWPAMRDGTECRSSGEEEKEEKVQEEREGGRVSIMASPSPCTALFTITSHIADWHQHCMMLSSRTTVGTGLRHHYQCSRTCPNACHPWHQHGTSFQWLNGPPVSGGASMHHTTYIHLSSAPPCCPRSQQSAHYQEVWLLISGSP